MFSLFRKNGPKKPKNTVESELERLQAIAEIKKSDYQRLINKARSKAEEIELRKASGALSRGEMNILDEEFKLLRDQVEVAYSAHQVAFENLRQQNRIKDVAGLLPLAEDMVDREEIETLSRRVRRAMMARQENVQAADELHVAMTENSRLKADDHLHVVAAPKPQDTSPADTDRKKEVDTW